jgi:4-hydroxy-2-oxovalerate/4-hydroxy-2-oxohexanoate aldolase
MSTPRIKLHDMCLRDGMHPKRHQISLEQMASIACGLDEAGVPLIEVTHGDGLGGASINYGFPSHSDEDYLRHVVPKLKQAKVSVLLIPGIGTVEDLKMAADCGIHTVRVATLCTEADVSEQHIKAGRDMGLDTVGFLMMAHMIDAEQLAAQGLLMESYGAQTIYCTDSAGYMLPADVTARISALRKVLKPETEIGFHGHHNLSLGVTNSLAAVEAGATRIDGSAAGLGAVIGAAVVKAAQRTPALAVFVRAGTYAEPVLFTSAVTVYGGFDQAWNRSGAATTVIQAPSPAVTFEGVTGAGLDGMTVKR